MTWKEIVDAFPDVLERIDSDSDLSNSGEFVEAEGRHLLIVTQTGEFEGGQHLFEIDGKLLRPVYADNVVSVARAGRSVFYAETLRERVCDASSSEDHKKVHEAAQDEVDRFSSATGPDHGNLACVWAVRHIVKNALGRWITKTDGTAVLGAELKKCFGKSSNEADVPAGGIIISPTQGRNIGHVGILGPSTGGSNRLIYSNSSRAAMWKQSHTLEKWISYYNTKKKLQVLYFPLPDSRGK